MGGMTEFNLQVETNLLLAKQEINGFSYNTDILNWALLPIDKGYVSDNLYILAGLDIDDIWGFGSYFQKVLEDLNMNSNTPRKVLIDFYLIYNIEETLNNPNLLTEELIEKLDKSLYNSSFYLNDRLNFFSLYDELDDLVDITREEYALKEFKNFIIELYSSQNLKIK